MRYVLLALTAFSLVTVACGKAPQTAGIGAPKEATPLPPSSENTGGGSDTGQVGNGGFLISRTSVQILDQAQQRLLVFLKGLDEEVLREHLNTPKLEKAALLGIIQNIDKQGLDGVQTYGVDKKTGLRQPRHFTYDSTKRTLIVQPFYYTSFASRSVESKVIYEVMIDILHEAVHLFEIDEAHADVLVEPLLRYAGLSETCLNILVTSASPDTQCVDLTTSPLEYSTSFLDSAFGTIGRPKRVSLMSGESQETLVIKDGQWHYANGQESANGDAGDCLFSRSAKKLQCRSHDQSDPALTIEFGATVSVVLEKFEATMHLMSPQSTVLENPILVIEK